MPQAALILAVEPDRRQSSKIANLARNTLQAELQVVEGVQQALELIDGRVPDLILTSLLLSPKDEGILSDKLRDLDAAGAHVQTLVIPVLASSGLDSETKGGLLSRFRRGRTNAAAPEGCDPAVFGAQIAEYLDRASHERARRTTSQSFEHVKVRDSEPAASLATATLAGAGTSDEWMRQVLLEHPRDPSLETAQDSRHAPAQQVADRSGPEAPAVVSSSWADPFGGPTTSTASTASRESSAPYVSLVSVEAYAEPAAPEMSDLEPTPPFASTAYPEREPAPPVIEPVAMNGPGDLWSVEQTAHPQDDASPAHGGFDIDANAMSQVVSLAESAAEARAGADRSWEHVRAAVSEELATPAEPLESDEPIELVRLETTPEAATVTVASTPAADKTQTSANSSEMLVVEPTSFSAPAFEVRTWEALPDRSADATPSSQETVQAPPAKVAPSHETEAIAEPESLEVVSVQALGDEGWEEIAFESPLADAPQVETHQLATSALDITDLAMTEFDVVEELETAATTDRLKDVVPFSSSNLRDAPSAAEPWATEPPPVTPTPPPPEPIGSIDLGSFVSALEAAEAAARESQGQFAPLTCTSAAAPKDTVVSLADAEPEEPEQPRRAVSIEPFVLPVVPRPEPARSSLDVDRLSPPSPAGRSAVDEFLEAVAEVTERPFVADLPLEAGSLPETTSWLGTDLEIGADHPLAADMTRAVQFQAVDAASAARLDTAPVSQEPDVRRAANKSIEEDAWRTADRGTPTAWPVLETPLNSADAANEPTADSSWPESLEGIRDHLELLDILTAARRDASATDPADPVVEFISALQRDETPYAPVAAPAAPAEQATETPAPTAPVESTPTVAWAPVSIGSKQAWPILEDTHAELAARPPADFADQWLSAPAPPPAPATRPTPRIQPPFDAQIEAAQRAADRPLVELLEALRNDTRRDLHEIKGAPPAEPSDLAIQAQAPSAPPVGQVERSPRRGKKGRKRPPPQEHRRSAVAVQDEWGFFDPAQCGFSALLAKLDELAAADSEAARPR